MTRSISRRGALKSAGALAATAAVAKPSILLGQAAMPRVTYVTLATGFNVILNEYMAAKRFDLKHGVNIDVINSYVSVTNYYNDFTAGTFELGIGAWDTWAARFLAGVPLKLISTVTDYDMLYVVAMQGGPEDGRRLARQDTRGDALLRRVSGDQACALDVPQHGRPTRTTRCRTPKARPARSRWCSAAAPKAASPGSRTSASAWSASRN